MQTAIPYSTKKCFPVDRPECMGSLISMGPVKKKMSLHLYSTLSVYGSLRRFPICLHSVLLHGCQTDNQLSESRAVCFRIVLDGHRQFCGIVNSPEYCTNWEDLKVWTPELNEKLIRGDVSPYNGNGFVFLNCRHVGLGIAH